MPPGLDSSECPVWDWSFKDVYLDRDTNVFQCAGNPLLRGVFRDRFNFAYGWNTYGLDDQNRDSD